MHVLVLQSAMLNSSHLNLAQAHVLYSGADDSIFQAWDLRCEADAVFVDRCEHVVSPHWCPGSKRTAALLSLASLKSSLMQLDECQQKQSSLALTCGPAAVA